MESSIDIMKSYLGMVGEKHVFEKWLWFLLWAKRQDYFLLPQMTALWFKRFPFRLFWSFLASKLCFCFWVLLSLTVEKAMAPHSSTLAWKIPWMEESGRLQSMGSRRVRHDWATSLSLFTFMHWRRKWQPTPVFLPGESQGPGSLVGCCLCGHTESDTTEAT